MSDVLSRGKHYDLEDVNLFSAACVALFMAGWLADQSTTEALHAGLSSMENGHRFLADQYLMHSLLMEFVITQNQKGVALDLTTVIAKYIRLWSYRPMPDCIRRRLAKLVWQRSARRRFGVNLRREWSLCLNNFPHPRELSTDQIRSKATSSWQFLLVHTSGASVVSRFLLFRGFVLVPWYFFHGLSYVPVYSQQHVVPSSRYGFFFAGCGSSWSTLCGTGSTCSSTWTRPNLRL